ncbi:MAG: hypothetical protein ABI557_12325 [Aureliella sp.]
MNAKRRHAGVAVFFSSQQESPWRLTGMLECLSLVTATTAGIAATAWRGSFAAAIYVAMTASMTSLHT